MSVYETLYNNILNSNTKWYSNRRKNVIKKCCYPQEAEEGLADGEIPTEEVINILKRSYKSCGIYEQVGSQVAEICKQVSNRASIN